MSALEMCLMVGLGLPIVVLSFAFVVCAGVMQLREEQGGKETRKGG